jgi:hypothetical protein
MHGIEATDDGGVGLETVKDIVNQMHPVEDIDMHRIDSPPPPQQQPQLQPPSPQQQQQPTPLQLQEPEKLIDGVIPESIGDISPGLSELNGNGAETGGNCSKNIDTIISLFESNAVPVPTSHITDHSNYGTRKDISLSGLMISFNLLDNVVFCHRKRNKTLSWDEITASFNAISCRNLTLETLLRILSVWQEAYDLIWVSKSSTSRCVNSSSCNSRISDSIERGFQGDYKLMLDIPVRDKSTDVYERIGTFR